MSVEAVSFSAPGSVMLMGEHAVLFGELALVAAVNRRLSVEISPRDDLRVRVSSALGELEGDLTHLPESPSLRFVIEAIRRQARGLPSGLDLHVRMDAGFSSTVGLGSSAAVCAATVASILRFCGKPVNRDSVFEEALAVVHAVQQGRGSGADLAASLCGGVVGYRARPPSMEALPSTLPLGLFYVGYKTPTPEVIARVASAAALEPELYGGLYALMGQVSQRARQHLLDGNLTGLGRVFSMYQGLMDALGVCDVGLGQMIQALRQGPGVLGAKISGSGLGDCVLGLGDFSGVHLQAEAIPIQVDPKGLYDEIGCTSVGA